MPKPNRTQAARNARADQFRAALAAATTLDAVRDVVWQWEDSTMALWPVLAEHAGAADETMVFAMLAAECRADILAAARWLSPDLATRIQTWAERRFTVGVTASEWSYALTLLRRLRQRSPSIVDADRWHRYFEEIALPPRLHRKPTNRMECAARALLDCSPERLTRDDLNRLLRQYRHFPDTILAITRHPLADRALWAELCVEDAGAPREPHEMVQDVKTLLDTPRACEEPSVRAFLYRVIPTLPDMPAALNQMVYAGGSDGVVLFERMIRPSWSAVYFLKRVAEARPPIAQWLTPADLAPCLQGSEETLREAAIFALGVLPDSPAPRLVPTAAEEDAATRAGLLDWLRAYAAQRRFTEPLNDRWEQTAITRYGEALRTAPSIEAFEAQAQAATPNTADDKIAKMLLTARETHAAPRIALRLAGAVLAREHPVVSLAPEPAAVALTPPAGAAPARPARRR